MAITQDQKQLIFRIGPISCCLPSITVESIIMPPRQETHGAHGKLPSLFRHSGETARVIDVRAHFGLSPSQADKGKILLHRREGKLLAFWVDEVVNIADTDDGRMEMLPSKLPREIFDAVFVYRQQLILVTRFDKLEKATPSPSLAAHIHELEQAQEAKTRDKAPSQAASDTDEKASNTPPATTEPQTKAATPPPISTPASAPAPTPESTSVSTPSRETTAGSKTSVPKPLRPNSTPKPHTVASASTSTSTTTHKPSRPPSRVESKHTATPAPTNRGTTQTQTTRPITPPASVSTAARAVSPTSQRVTPPSVATTEPSTPPPHTPSVTPSNEEEGGFGGLILMLVVVLLLLGLAAWWWLGDSTPQPRAITKSAPQISPVKEEPTLEADSRISSVEVGENEETGVESTESSPHAEISREQQTITITLHDQPAPTEEADPAEGEDTPSTPDAETEADESVAEEAPTAQTPQEAAKTTEEKAKPSPAKPKVITHVVVKGDTLWDIAERYVDDPFRYPELARLSKIKNPHRIYPGDIVRIIKQGTAP